MCDRFHALRWAMWVALVAFCFSGDCAQAQSLFNARTLAGADRLSPVTVLVRTPLAAPARYRLVYIPGSGCSGLASVADPMFRGLLHARLALLHKPGVRLDAGAAPVECPAGFVQSDDMRSWLTHAKATVLALQEDDLATGNAALPLILVGVSEGAELLPFLAAALLDVVGLVMISGAGLDPVEAGAMQAARLGETGEWQALARAQASSQPDDQLHDGRTLRYWRSLWGWRSQEALLSLPIPLLQVWGDSDTLLPAEAYQRFAERARHKPGGYCQLRFVGADHGLQTAGRDGLQTVWALIERWARLPAEGLCITAATMPQATP